MRGPCDHIGRNRGSWDRAAAEYLEPGRENWEAVEPTWGIWGVPESEVGVLPEKLDGRDVVELGCGTGYVSAWLARRGARPVGIDLSWNQLSSAAGFQREFGLRFPLIHGNAERAPFRDLTVDEIARAAGLSRSAFYTHFGDKHDLLMEAVAEVAEELYRMADRWWGGQGPPADRVRESLEGVVGIYADQATLMRVATEVSTYDDEVRAVWIGIVERFIEATAEHVRSEQALGLIPAALEPRATAEGLIWMCERCAYIYLARRERRPEELVEAMAPVWTAALYPGVIPAAQLRP